jgi:hypothetical protein
LSQPIIKNIALLKFQPKFPLNTIKTSHKEQNFVDQVTC